MKIQALTAEKAKSSKNILIYGESGVGKTILASGAEMPFYIDIDRGLKRTFRFTKNKKIYFCQPDSWDDLTEALRFLKEDEHKFKTVVLDTLTETQKLAMLKIIGEEREVMTQQEWQKNLEKLRRLIVAFRNLDINFIAICHMMESRDDNGENITQLRPLVPGKFGISLPAYFDVVGYLEVKRGKNKEGEEVIFRRITFEKTEKIVAKKAYGLPDYINNPTWEKISKFMEE